MATDSRHHRILDVEIGEIVEIRQAHIAGHDVAILVVFLVVLLACHLSGDLAKDEGQHVLHGDDAGHLTVFTQDDSDPRPVRLEIVEHLVHLLGGRHVMGRLQDHFQGHRRQIAAATDELQNVLGMDETDDVVPVTFVYGHTWVTEAAELLDQLVHGQRSIQKKDARPRGHDPRNIRLRGFEQIVDQHPFGSIDNPGLFTLFEQRPQFIRLQDVFPVNGIADHQRGDLVRHQAHGLTQRRYQDHPARQNTGTDYGTELDGEADRNGLRGHLTDQQQQRDHDQYVDPAHVLSTENDQQNRRHIDGRGDIDQLVTTQDRDDQAARLIQHRVDTLRVFVARLPELLQIDATKRKQRCFGSGEYGR